ncbi:C25 family cysteine peptidase, partial [Kaarinaea lacus]
LDFYLQTEVTVEYSPRGAIPETADKAVSFMAAPFVKSVNNKVQATRLVSLAKERVVNPEAVWDFSELFPVFIGQVDYLIITDDRRWDANTITPLGDAGDLTETFQKLADWKATRGLKSKVVTITQIVNGIYGNFTSGARDLQEVIRNFLKWAHNNWGVSWLLLGGDINIVPVRQVAGALRGHINKESTNPPNDNKSYWTGSYMRMHVVNPGEWWPGGRTDHLLVRPDNGLFIPFDATGSSSTTQRGWFFTTDDSYSTRSAVPTNYVRVNGPSAEVNASLQFLYQWNTLPTDFYYASLVGANYNQPGLHDWDLLNNGIYGQHRYNTDHDGVDYQADVSVGRAPVSSTSQAEAFVNKVIAYEKFRKPDGGSLSSSWPRKLLLISSNWGGRIHFSSTATFPPSNNRYYHGAGDNHSLMKLKDIPGDLNWRLIVKMSDTDLRIKAYNRTASAGSPGWYYAVSENDLSVSEITINIPFVGAIHIPKPTNWIVFYGIAAELTPDRFILDFADPDGSMSDQELLREQVATDHPQLNLVNRLYEDEIDLTPAQMAAAPIQHLTQDRVEDALNNDPHFVSLSGHGGPGGTSGLDIAMAQTLTNGYHSMIGYADSCLTSQFDGEDAVSEHLVYNPNGGAVAYVGNSRFSWIGVGDNFQRAFFKRMDTTRHLGLINDSRCDEISTASGNVNCNKWHIFTLNLIGDPEMPVWVGTPKTMKVNFKKQLDKRQPFKVTVTRRVLFFDVPLVGATVEIKQGAFTRQESTNAAGIASFDISSTNIGEMEVTVTKVGYRPFMDTCEVVGPLWVSGMVKAIIHQHGHVSQSLVRMQLQPAVEGDSDRGWYARKSLPDYRIILDAVTDAYVAEKKISLFVNSIKQNGTIERFRFQKISDLLVEKFPETLTLADVSDTINVTAEATAGTEAEITAETETSAVETETSAVDELASETN